MGYIAGTFLGSHVKHNSFSKRKYKHSWKVVHHRLYSLQTAEVGQCQIWRTVLDRENQCHPRHSQCPHVPFCLSCKCAPCAHFARMKLHIERVQSSSLTLVVLTLESQKKSTEGLTELKGLGHIWHFSVTCSYLCFTCGEQPAHTPSLLLWTIPSTPNKVTLNLKKKTKPIFKARGSDQSPAAVQQACMEQQCWQRALAGSSNACWLLSDQRWSLGLVSVRVERPSQRPRGL